MKQTGTHDILMDETASFVHTHDDSRSAIQISDGTVYGGPTAFADASQRTEVVTCDEMRELESNRSRSALSRRSILKGMGVGGVLAVSPLNRYAFAADAAINHTIVMVFLRGGFDGLNAVAPMGDPNYQALRPNLGITDSVLIPIEGSTFGLHPALTEFKAMMDAGDMTLIHSTGHPDTSRSHFTKQFLHEAGAASATMRTGWLGRYLASGGGYSDVMRALTIGNTTSFALAHNKPTLTVSSLRELTIPGADQRAKDRLKDVLNRQWSGLTGSGADSMNQMIEAALTFGSLNTSRGGTQLESRLRDVLSIIQTTDRLEVACVDSDGWDTHTNVGQPGSGYFHNKLRELSSAVGSFWNGLGDAKSRVTMMIVSEFGRTAKSNDALGADHGYGNCMFVVSKGVKSKVVGSWPGLSAGSLSGGDLDIVNDYRNVVGEILSTKFQVDSARMGTILPDYSYKPAGLY